MTVLVRHDGWFCVRPEALRLLDSGRARRRRLALS